MSHVAMLRHDEADGLWYAELKDEPRVHTFGASAAEALSHLADAAALWYGDVRRETPDA